MYKYARNRKVSINKIGQRIVMLIEKFIFLFEKDKPVYVEFSRFNYLMDIEDNYIIIKNELLKFTIDNFKSMEELSIEQQRIVKENQWKVLFLKACGIEIQRNSIYFPNTYQLLKNNKIKNAFFSILQPNTHITPHRGVYKGFLRYHLGLVIPKNGEVGIKIDNVSYHWEEGKSLIFDDTFIHEAWNFTNEKRIILLLDIERDFKFPFNLINKIIIFIISLSPLIRSIIKKS